MADPERIWLEPECCADPEVGQCWSHLPQYVDECGVKPTEYVRADIAEAYRAVTAVERKDYEAEIARLRAEIDMLRPKAERDDALFASLVEWERTSGPQITGDM